jgi:hypothetical protein
LFLFHQTAGYFPANQPESPGHALLKRRAKLRKFLLSRYIRYFKNDFYCQNLWNLCRTRLYYVPHESAHHRSSSARLIWQQPETGIHYNEFLLIFIAIKKRYD